MVRGPLSRQSSHGPSSPDSDPPAEAEVPGRLLAEELEQVRERALARLEGVANDLGRGMDGSAAEEAEYPNEDELTDDDDLGLPEIMRKCRTLRASLMYQWASSHRTPSPDRMEELLRINDAIDRTLMRSVTRARARARRSHEMFLAMLAHDLRTPLGAIVMASEYLVARGELTDRDLRLASRIRSSGHRMNGLVNDLLDFTRCRMGEGIPIEPTRTSVGALALEVVEEVRAAHPECEMHVEVSGPVQGYWDGGRLWQALSNLVQNAVRHGDGGGVRVTVSGEPEEVVVSVHNTGDEIAPEARKRMFSPFERCAEDPGGRTRDGGLGLGLYIAREIASAHGGTITVSSSSEAGTTFELHLPRAR